MSGETIITPDKPGFYADIDFDTYAAWDAVNASTLNGFSRTPAHVRYEMTHGGKPRTPALELGWLVHLYILQRDRFEKEIVVPPKVDRRTKVGKAKWNKFLADYPDAQLIDQETMDKTAAMAKSLMEHETAKAFYAGRGLNEVSILWEDKDHGVRCKARIDRVGMLNEWPIIGDLKTARSAARRDVERSIHSFGYHIQAVHYLVGLEALVPVPTGNPFRRFVFFVIESEPPYCVAVYELDDAALEEGAIKRSQYLRKWRECVERGEWPGYPPGIEYASLPAWAFKSWSDE